MGKPHQERLQAFQPSFFIHYDFWFGHCLLPALDLLRGGLVLILEPLFAAFASAILMTLYLFDISEVASTINR
jgi:hypothetical protein